MGEAVAHEICRTYALGMLACPSSVLRLTHRMSEADLPIDFAGQVNLQFPLLSRLLGRPLPVESRQIFRIASGVEMERNSEAYEENLLSKKMSFNDLRN